MWLIIIIKLQWPVRQKLLLLLLVRAQAEVTSRVSAADNQAAAVTPRRTQMTARAPRPLAKQYQNNLDSLDDVIIASNTAAVCLSLLYADPTDDACLFCKFTMVSLLDRSENMAHNIHRTLAVSVGVDIY